MTTPRAYSSDGRFWGPVDSAIEIAKFDLCFWNADDVRPAASLTDQGSEGDNQAYFASLFAGVAHGYSESGTAESILFDANPLREFEFDCVSTTYEVGDLLGVDEASSGTALENQKLAKVTDPDAAIMICTRQVATAATRVRCRIMPGRGGNFTEGTRHATNSETLTGTRTLTLDDAEYQAIDPGGAVRQLNLPPEAASAGRRFVVYNAGSAGEILTFKEDSGTTTICTIDADEQAELWCDGTTWRGTFGVKLTA